jgi:hypothetical protein
MLHKEKKRFKILILVICTGDEKQLEIEGFRN